MIKYLYLLMVFFFGSQSMALEFRCNFEEAYSNGQSNLGSVLYKEGNLRYEYNSPDLFTIFINDKGKYLYKNDTQKITQISKNLQLIETLIKIAKKYPNIPLKIDENNYQISIELSKATKFIKRVAIVSSRVNLSLYLLECNIEKPINNLFFKTDPVFPLN